MPEDICRVMYFLSLGGQKDHKRNLGLTCDPALRLWRRMKLIEDDAKVNETDTVSLWCVGGRLLLKMMGETKVCEVKRCKFVRTSFCIDGCYVGI